MPTKTGGMLRVFLAPAPITAAQAASTARRLLTTVTVQYQPSGLIARKLAIDPRTLGKLTGETARRSVQTWHLLLPEEVSAVLHGI